MKFADNNLRRCLAALLPISDATTAMDSRLSQSILSAYNVNSRLCPVGASCPRSSEGFLQISCKLTENQKGMVVEYHHPREKKKAMIRCFLLKAVTANGTLPHCSSDSYCCVGGEGIEQKSGL